MVVKTRFLRKTLITIFIGTRIGPQLSVGPHMLVNNSFLPEPFPTLQLLPLPPHHELVVVVVIVVAVVDVYHSLYT